MVIIQYLFVFFCIGQYAANDFKSATAAATENCHYHYVLIKRLPGQNHTDNKLCKNDV